METKTNIHYGKISCIYPQAQTLFEVTVIKPYNTSELCRVYGVTDKTFAKWLKPFINDIGPKYGRYYTVIQVEIIFTKLGMPYRLKD